MISVSCLRDISVRVDVQKVAGDNVGSEIKNILKEVDRNGDGRIDYEEFCDMMRQVSPSILNNFSMLSSIRSQVDSSSAMVIVSIET